MFLDCEFTSMSRWAKLISLALVAENGQELYVELSDTWAIEDCSEFVISTVLPQLWKGDHCMTMNHAQRAVLSFVDSLSDNLEVVTDSPDHDWRHFQAMVAPNGIWPKTISQNPIDAAHLEPVHEGSDLPHHALLDARIIAGMFAGE